MYAGHGCGVPGLLDHGATERARRVSSRPYCQGCVEEPGRRSEIVVVAHSDLGVSMYVHHLDSAQVGTL